MQPIQDYEEKYSACPTGKIWTTGSNKLPNGGYLKPWLIGHGYEMVMLYKDKVPKKFLVHRLIATTFIPNPQGLKEVNHKNGVIRDNRPDNLEWVTSKDNKAHAWSNGLYTHRGEHHWKSKLTPDKVSEIRRLCKSGVRQSEVARQFNLDPMCVSLIVRRKSWKHID